MSELVIVMICFWHQFCNKKSKFLITFHVAGVGHSHLDLFSPAEIAEHIMQIIKPVCVHMEKISTLFHVSIV